MVTQPVSWFSLSLIVGAQTQPSFSLAVILLPLSPSNLIFLLGDSSCFLHKLRSRQRLGTTGWVTHFHSHTHSTVGGTSDTEPFCWGEGRRWVSLHLFHLNGLQTLCPVGCPANCTSCVDLLRAQVSISALSRPASMLPMPVGRTNLVGQAWGAEMGGRALGETQQEMGSGYLEEKLELGSEDGGCGWGTDEWHRWAAATFWAS